MSFIQRISSGVFERALTDLENKNIRVKCLTWIMPRLIYLEWANSVGVSSHPQLRDIVAPVPPPEQRTLVAAEEEEVFLWSGIKDVSSFMDIFAEIWVGDWSTRPRVLDFGCGCGRMSRFLANDPFIRAFATDINDRHVTWCRQNLLNVTTKLNDFEPPLPFDDASLDLVYSLSIFTHLDEHVAAGWFKDIARVVAPNGIVILTTHGYPALETIEGSAHHQGMFRKSAEEISELKRELVERKYTYIPYEPDVVLAANAGPSYGNAFMHPDYANRHWNAYGLEVVRHVAGGVRGWQDIWVLKKEG